jgi:ABC-type sugar transport system ATPase subunit
MVKENDEYILEMSGISKSFPGVKALDNVDFHLKKGEIMGLIGENGAGKSTLMKIILGLYQRDEGSIKYKKADYTARNTHDALGQGISMIHQEISLVPDLSVGENIWLGRESEFSFMGIIDNKKRDSAARELMCKIGLDPDGVTRLVNSLSVAQTQLVELARAISYDTDIIIMDEPTSSLTDVEIEILYKTIRKLKEDGVSIVFISHKLDEILTICDRVTVMRDGKSVGGGEVEGLDENSLISMIVGYSLDDIYPEREVQTGETMLEVRSLTRAPAFKNISFSVKKGEVLGFCGLIGAGRSEIARAIFGLDKPDSGEIFIDSKSVSIKSPSDAIALKIGMVNEDRREYGILRAINIKENVSIADLNTLSSYGFIKVNAEKEKVDGMVKSLSVKCSSANQLIESLSGGNQQKALIGRMLMIKPKILILDEPTRGIDIGAKKEIYSLINMLTKSGMALIMISSELPELMGMSDRILVVHNGEIVGEHKRGEFEQDKLMADAFGINGGKTCENFK